MAQQIDGIAPKSKDLYLNLRTLKVEPEKCVSAGGWGSCTSWCPYWRSKDKFKSQLVLSCHHGIQGCQACLEVSTLTFAPSHLFAWMNAMKHKDGYSSVKCGEFTLWTLESQYA